MNERARTAVKEGMMAETKAYGSAGVGFIDGDYMAFSQLRLPVTDLGFLLAFL